MGVEKRNQTSNKSKHLPQQNHPLLFPLSLSLPFLSTKICRREIQTAEQKILLQHACLVMCFQYSVVPREKHI